MATTNAWFAELELHTLHLLGARFGVQGHLRQQAPMQFRSRQLAASRRAGRNVVELPQAVTK